MSFCGFTLAVTFYLINTFQPSPVQNHKLYINTVLLLIITKWLIDVVIMRVCVFSRVSCSAELKGAKEERGQKTSAPLTNNREENSRTHLLAVLWTVLLLDRHREGRCDEFPWSQRGKKELNSHLLLLRRNNCLHSLWWRIHTHMHRHTGWLPGYISLKSLSHFLLNARPVYCLPSKHSQSYFHLSCSSIPSINHKHCCRHYHTALIKFITRPQVSLTCAISYSSL